MIVFVIIFISNSERALPIKILKELQTSKIMIWMNVPWLGRSAPVRNLEYNTTGTHQHITKNGRLTHDILEFYRTYVLAI